MIKNLKLLELQEVRLSSFQVLICNLQVLVAALYQEQIFNLQAMVVLYQEQTFNPQVSVAYQARTFSLQASALNLLKHLPHTIHMPHLKLFLQVEVLQIHLLHRLLFHLEVQQVHMYKILHKIIHKEEMVDLLSKMFKNLKKEIGH